MSMFDDKAAEWDTPDRVERAHDIAEIVRKRVPLTTDMRVIDVGSGTGLLGLDLLADVGSVVLADPSQGMIDVAERKIAPTGSPTPPHRLRPTRPTRPPGRPSTWSSRYWHCITSKTPDGPQVGLRDAGPGRPACVDRSRREDGSFHDPDEEGIHHHGFDPGQLAPLTTDVGFEGVAVEIVYELEREGRGYPLMLLTGARPEG